jgi:hypothetical protein
MAKALTVAGIARYKPSKQRREIRDSAATGLYLILQESGQRSFALRFRKPNGKPAKLTLGPVDVSGDASGRSMSAHGLRFSPPVFFEPPEK